MKAYIFLVVGSLLLGTSTAQGITAGQVDDFEIGGDTANWTGGKPGFSPAPSQVPDGGPGGLGDGYLQISVAGFHLGTRNLAGQWAGDYLAAGVTAIEMDVNRIAGPSNVSLRILLFGPGGTWASTNLAPTLTGPGWQHLSFGLSAADLTHVTGSTKPQAPDGTGILGDTLSGVTDLLIRHDSATPTIPGNHPPHITATLGIDNITALLAGDVNNDGFVGGGDLNSIISNWGLVGATRIQGDLTGEGDVGGADYNEVLGNWGAGTPPPPEVIPEPVTLGLLLLGGLALLRRRK